MLDLFQLTQLVISLAWETPVNYDHPRKWGTVFQGGIMKRIITGILFLGLQLSAQGYEITTNGYFFTPEGNNFPSGRKGKLCAFFYLMGQPQDTQVGDDLPICVDNVEIGSFGQVQTTLQSESMFVPFAFQELKVRFTFDGHATKEEDVRFFFDLAWATFSFPPVKIDNMHADYAIRMAP